MVLVISIQYTVNTNGIDIFELPGAFLYKVNTASVGYYLSTVNRPGKNVNLFMML